MAARRSVNLFTALTIAVANFGATAAYNAHGVALDATPLIQRSLQPAESTEATESVKPEESADPKEPADLAVADAPVLPIKHAQHKKHLKHLKQLKHSTHKKKHSKWRVKPDHYTERMRQAQLAHGEARPSAQTTYVNDTNIFSLLGRGLRGFAPFREPSKVFVSFAVVHEETGTTVELDFDESMAKCGYKYEEEYDVRITHCTFYLDRNSTEVKIPTIRFNMVKPESSMATTSLHGLIATMIKKVQYDVARFSVNCRSCGEPCPFWVLGRYLSLEVPPCPLPAAFEIPLDLWQIQRFTPPGAVLDLGTQDFRAGTRTLAWLLRLQV